MFRNFVIMFLVLSRASRSVGFQNRPRKMRCLPKSLYSNISSNDSSLKNVISSTKSNTVKRIQQLLKKPKKRNEENMAIVEGPRMIFDLLANAKTRPLVRQILVSVDDYEKEFRDKLTKFSSSSNYQLQLVAPDVFQTLSDTITPQGIIAVAERPSLSVDPSSRQPIYLVLDGVSDPGNVGTLIRSCLAVGCAGIILLPQCCDAWSPKTLRSSMGASFLLPIVQEKSWENALDRLGSWNVLNENIYAASMLDGGESEAYFDIDWQTSPSALVIGSEGNGLSHEVRNHVQERRINSVYVPMNPGIESLNAAVCGSVVLFEYSRQCNVI